MNLTPKHRILSHFTILLVLFYAIFFINSLSAQDYNVRNYQKINESNGGFMGDLDNFDSWGIAIDNIGDLDGNGVADLAVGAYTDDDGGFNQGAVWILFLDANNQVISHSKISATSGNFTGNLDDDDRFGGSVAYLGDLNSDGLIELAVGADYDGDGGFWHGAVWILSLNADGTVNSHVKISDTQGGFGGFINGDAIFGTDMENIGDLNNDGVIDLAVGSRRDADGGSRRGAVWILFMNSDLTVNSFQKISDTEGGFTPALEFEDYFGGSILNFGDQNGDGTNDILVGTYRDDDLNVNSGSFYLLYLNDDGTVLDHRKVSNLSGGLANVISANALFAESIDGTNDIDGDGIPEVLVGALGHNNPTLGTSTGAFYMIELDANGMVTEDHFYTYGEYCFSGNLSGGDFFGGAVTLLQPGSNPKIAVSAYHDSENGPERGAVWILDLGEINYSIVDETDPTCGLENGSFAVTGLIPNMDYTVEYEYEGSVVNDLYLSDSSGRIEILNLGSGSYESISVTEYLINCTDMLGSVVLSESTINPTIDLVDPSSCGSDDGAIILGNLLTNADYSISYFFNGTAVTTIFTTNAGGNLSIQNLSAGNYINFEIFDPANSCTAALGNFTLSDSDLDLQFQVSSESVCGNSDGSIEIEGLAVNTTYTISYLFGGSMTSQEWVSSPSGEILLSNLASGLYEGLNISNSSNGCTSSLGDIEVGAAILEVSSTYENPSFCGLSDGSIRFSGLNPNTEYEINYSFDNTTQMITITSDNIGQIDLETLNEGSYSSLDITDINNGCRASIGEIILSDPVFSPEILVNHPASCISEDGSIFVSGLVANAPYTISFVKQSEQESMAKVADGNGQISIESLSVGSYEDFTITDQNNICEFNTPLVEVSCSGNLIGCFTTKNFFTPNGDGINDRWYLESLDDCEYQIKIFDRYGKLIGTLTPNNPYWDGTYNGNLMPSNDYWYSVQYLEDSSTKTYRSHFSLKR